VLDEFGQVLFTDRLAFLLLGGDSGARRGAVMLFACAVVRA
jgi:hypothetical protein